MRSPWAVALLPIVTLGIYQFVWWYRINRELRDLGRARGSDLGEDPTNSLLALFPGALVVVPLVVSYWRGTTRTQAAARIAGREPLNGWLALVLFVVIPPGFCAYIQGELNEVWRGEADPLPGQPPLPANDAPRASSRAGYWIGGALVAAGVLGAVLWFVTSLARVSGEVDDFQRLPLPGTATLRLEARKYVIYYEARNADKTGTGFDLEINDARTGAALDTRRYEDSLTYSFGHAGSAQATVTPPRASDYVIRAKGGDGARGAHLAVGRSLAGAILRTLLVTFAIGGLFAGSGVVLLVITGIRRRRVSRAPQPMEAEAPPPSRSA